MNAYPYHQAIYTEYRGPTNSHGSRIIVTLRRGVDTIKKTMPYDHSTYYAHDAAVERALDETLRKDGDNWQIIAKGESQNGKGYVYLAEWKS